MALSWNRKFFEEEYIERYRAAYQQNGNY